MWSVDQTEPFGIRSAGRALAATASYYFLTQPENDSIYPILACLPSPYVFSSLTIPEDLIYSELLRWTLT